MSKTLDRAPDRAIDEAGPEAGPNNPVLLTLVAAIRAAYGSRIERIVLFGSRARGDAEEDSDYDVAVFMHGLHDRQEEVRRLWKIERAITSLEDPIFEVIPVRAGSWADATEFMENLRREGIEL